MGFNRAPNYVRPGEPVKAGVANRAAREIEGNVEFVFDLLEGSAAASALLLPDVPVAAALLVGQPVYFNAATNQYEAALADTIADDTSGLVVMAESSKVWGLLAEKSSATIGTLLLLGSKPLAMTSAILGAVAPGMYFLSGTAPGMLTPTRAPWGIPVCQLNANGDVLVLPQWRTVFDDHAHYRFPLQPVPAGATSDPGTGRHVITDPDTHVEGWLPAEHSSFGGTAPAGAKFGYNLAKNQALADAWPPRPLTGATLVWDKGKDAELMGMEVPLGPQQLCTIDVNGIWWNSDCAGDVPWPKESIGFDSTDSFDYYDSIDATPADVECPRALGMNLTLWFSKPTYATGKELVTSLRAETGGLLEIYCALDHSAKSTGDLVAAVRLASLDAGDTDTEGALVFKTLAGDKLHRGPVVEGLYTTSADLVIEGSVQQDVSIDSEDVVLNQGRVALSLSPTVGMSELPIVLVKLNGAEEEYPEDIPAISLVADRESSFTCKLDIPPAAPAASLQVRFTIAGSIAGTLPDLTFAYRRIPAAATVTEIAANEADPADLPTTDTEVALPLESVVLTAANQYVVVEAPLFSVLPGDAIVYKVSRADDDYAGDLYFLKQAGKLVTS